MADKRKDDRDLIEDAETLHTPSQQGSGGGNMARKVGQRDEYKTAEGGDPLPTTVDGRDRPEGGDRPSLPRRS
ncbi:MAG: hypothetical protein WCZ66_09700 [Sphingomonadaceae bacterium]